METKERVKTEKATEQLQLVKGDFTTSEASHVIMSLIDGKINFHKFLRFQNWERDHQCDTNPIDTRIAELEKEKEVARDFIDDARSKGKDLKIDGVLTISLAE